MDGLFPLFLEERWFLLQREFSSFWIELVDFSLELALVFAASKFFFFVIFEHFRVAEAY